MRDRRPDATVAEATTAEAATEQVTTGQATTGQATTGQATTGQATTGQATRGQPASGRATVLAREGLPRLIGEALRFGVVGVVGFVVDTATVYGAHFLAGLDLYTAGALAYLAAATTTWALNRAWTFADAPRDRPGRQWAVFVAVQLAGFALNRGTYAALVTFLPLAAAHPVLAVAAGSIAGMSVNFLTAKRIVFR
jgi:putative flippase GtrA